MHGFWHSQVPLRGKKGNTKTNVNNRHERQILQEQNTIALVKFYRNRAPQHWSPWPPSVEVVDSHRLSVTFFSRQARTIFPSEIKCGSHKCPNKNTTCGTVLRCSGMKVLCVFQAFQIAWTSRNLRVKFLHFCLSCGCDWFVCFHVRRNLNSKSAWSRRPEKLRDEAPAIPVRTLIVPLDFRVLFCRNQVKFAKKCDQGDQCWLSCSSS